MLPPPLIFSPSGARRGPAIRGCWAPTGGIRNPCLVGTQYMRSNTFDLRQFIVIAALPTRSREATMASARCCPTPIRPPLSSWTVAVFRYTISGLALACTSAACRLQENCASTKHKPANQKFAKPACGLEGMGLLLRIKSTANTKHLYFSMFH